MKSNNTVICLRSLKASLLVTSLVIPQLLFQSPAKADQWNKNPLKVACKSYETNKFDKKEQVVGGGWTPGWADDIVEKNVGLGLVSAGVSVFDGGSSFTIWVTNLVERTISSLGQSLEGNAKKEAIRVAQQVIYDAVSGKSGKEITKQFDTFDFKAGAIKYSGTNREPIFCNTISKTWGLKPYVAFRIRSSSNPSTANNAASNTALLKDSANNPGCPEGAFAKELVAESNQRFGK